MSSEMTWADLSPEAQERVARRAFPVPSDPVFTELRKAGFICPTSRPWQWSPKADTELRNAQLAQGLRTLEMERRMSHLEERFIYFTECALATVEELEMLARPPKGRLKRHREIADKMLFELKVLKVTPESIRQARGFRVLEALHGKDG